MRILYNQGSNDGGGGDNSLFNSAILGEIEQGNQGNDLTIVENPDAVAAGGFSFNEAGDLLSKEGTVIKTKDQLKPAGDGNQDEGNGGGQKGNSNDNPNEEEESVEVLLDDDGNIVDEDGGIILSKDKVKKDAEGNLILPEDFKPTEPTLVNLIQRELDVKIYDEEGKVKKYEDTPKGASEYIKDIAVQVKNETRLDFFKSHPELVKLHNHLVNGGNYKDFNLVVESTDWSAINLTELGVDEKVNLIKQSFAKKGVDGKTTDEIVNMYKTAGTIDDNAKVAQDFLVANKQQEDEAARVKFEQIETQRKENAVKYWTTVKETIDKGVLAGINIPATEKDAFFEYLAKPVENNQSKAALDRRNASLENKLLFDYLTFSKFDFSKLVEQKAKQVNVAKVKKWKTSHTGNGQRAQVQKVDNNSNVSMDTIVL
jgi:hypothetical protein